MKTFDEFKKGLSEAYKFDKNQDFMQLYYDGSINMSTGEISAPWWF